MIRNHRFAGLPFFLAQDKGGGNGGGETPKGTLEQQLAQAQSDLTAAQGSITALTKERDDAKSEVTKITGQFTEATQTATNLQTKVAGLETQVTNLTGQLTQSNEKLTKAEGNVVRLESLCRIKGVNPGAAVATVPDTNTPGNEHVYDKWVNATGNEKTRLYRAHKKEIRAEGMRRAADPRG